MNKHIRLLFMLSSIIIFNTKAEVETFVDIIETPAEIYNRCKQDIDTMHPDNSSTVKHILKIVIQAIDIAFRQLEASVNLLKNQPKPKESILYALNKLLRPRYEPIKGLSYEEVNVCTTEAAYKISILLLNTKTQELFESLSKHDQAIVRKIHDYIIGKIEYKNELLRHLPMTLNFYYNR